MYFIKFTTRSSITLFSVILVFLAVPAKSDSMNLPDSSVKPLTVKEARWKALLYTTLPIGVGMLVSSSSQRYGYLGQIPILYGIFVGPSMGNYYLEDKHGGNQGITYRLGGAALGIALPLIIILGGNWGGNSEAEAIGIYGGALFGAALFVGGTVWHLRRLPNAAKIHNAKQNHDQAVLNPLLLIAQPTIDLKNRALGVRLALQY